jgi:hypothetical protein
MPKLPQHLTKQEEGLQVENRASINGRARQAHNSAPCHSVSVTIAVGLRIAPAWAAFHAHCRPEVGQQARIIASEGLLSTTWDLRQIPSPPATFDATRVFAFDENKYSGVGTFGLFEFPAC